MAHSLSVDECAQSRTPEHWGQFHARAPDRIPMNDESKQTRMNPA